MKTVRIDDDVLYGSREDVLSERLSNEDIFTITWDGPEREKTSGNLPTFPSGVTKEATVRLAFTVSREGGVISVTPLTKGHPQFEKVSMEALRKWRFNPLDKGLSQKNQEGIITFRFELN